MGIYCKGAWTYDLECTMYIMQSGPTFWKLLVGMCFCWLFRLNAVAYSWLQANWLWNCKNCNIKLHFAAICFRKTAVEREYFSKTKKVFSADFNHAVKTSISYDI